MLVAGEQAYPLVGQGLVLALGRDAEVGAAEEDRGGLAGVVAWDREGAELVFEVRVAALGVGDDADLPAVGDDHRDVALREGLVLLELVAGLVGARKLRDQVVQLGEPLL